MTIDVFIIDDDPKAADALAAMVKQLLTKQHIACSITKALSPELLAWKKQEADAPCRLFFVDVVLPGSNGIRLIPKLRQQNTDRTLFVLISSEQGYAGEGYSVEAFDFIAKPFKKQNVAALLERAVRKFLSMQSGSFCFYANKADHAVDYSDILTITYSRNYATLQTTDEHYCFRCTMKELLQKLPDYFVRVSSNAIVNINHIASISRTRVSSRKYNISVEISKTYFDDVLAAFKATH